MFTHRAACAVAWGAGSRLTDFGVRFLRKLVNLRHIEICGGGLSDVGVEVLAGLSELRTMNLSQNGGITFRSAELLGALSVLESLNLSNTSVGAKDDGGWERALPPLQRLTSLTSLALYACPPLTADGTRTLRASLPRLLTLGTDAPDGGGGIASPVY
jgi:hypothetical protein